MLSLFMDFNALVVFFVIIIVSFFIYFKEEQKLNQFDKMTELSFYLALTTSLVWTVAFLSDLSDPKSIGPKISFSIMLMIYVTVLRVLSVLLLRAKRNR
ncbi:MAG: hypothetical protein GY760_09595 [Deltaproteobacteria bacterium]|nr:hypothetical protein [Deltaproteobacteria bacterium]